MTFYEQLFSYKNGLEITLTILTLIQAGYIFKYYNKKNIAGFHGTIFLLLGIHFIVLTLKNTFQADVPDIIFCILLIPYGPLSYWMTKNLVYPQFKLKALTILVIAIPTLFLFYIIDTKIPSLIFLEYTWNILFLIFAIRLMRAKKAGLGNLQTKWLTQFLAGFLIIFCSYLPVYLASLFMPAIFLSFKIPFTAMFLIFVLNNFRHIITRPSVMNFQRGTCVELKEGELKEIAASIEKQMESQKLYLTYDFNLRQLAISTGYNEHTISEVINRHYHQNFNQFINTYRIEAAVAQMKNDPDHKKLIKEIMFESGFNNKVSFINAFKNHLDTTPSSYRESLVKKPIKSRNTDLVTD